MGLPLIAAGLQLAGGLAQTIFSNKKKAIRDLENQTNNSPKVGANNSINKYYDEALNRYNENIYNGTLYNYQGQQAQRSFNQGLSALGDRRSALSGIGRLSAIQDDAMLKAGIQAEQQKNQRFGVLGNATNMKYGDDKYVYNNNVLMPYQRKLQLLQMKASGANETQNAGLSNMFQGGSNIATILGGGTTKKSNPTTASAGSEYQLPRLGSTLDNQNGVYYAPNAETQDDNLDNSFDPFSNRKYGKI